MTRYVERRRGANRLVERLARVPHAIQEQSRRRRSETRREWRRLDEKLPRLLGFQVATAHFDQNADDSPDHLPEEVRSLNRNEHELAVLHDLHPIDEDQR